MAVKHEYDPLLRVWIYGGPGEEGFDHTAEGWNWWAGDIAMGLVGTTLGDEPKSRWPANFDEFTREQKEAFWDQEAEKNLSPEMRDYLEKGFEALKAGVKAGVI